MTSFLEGRQEYDALGFKWLLDSKQLIDGAILAGGWEPDSTKVVNHFVKPGMVVCDIGANIGYYTLLMSRLVGPTGRVLTFEPMFEPGKLIAWHRAHNDVRNTKQFPYALDERDHAAEIFFNYSWRGAEPVEQHGDLVSFRRLDRVVEEESLERLDFLKIDVDGYEAKLMRGAMETLRRFHPTILLEVCDYTLRGAAGLGYLPRADNPIYGVEVMEMLGALKGIGYKFLWEEDLSPVADLSDVLTRFDLSARSINLVAVM